MPLVCMLSLQLQGLADGLDGVTSYQTLLQINMFPELIKASCTMYGAWGPAIAQCNDKGATLTQLRALDFGLDNPLSNYSMLAVYHPLEGL